MSALSALACSRALRGRSCAPFHGVVLLLVPLLALLLLLLAAPGALHAQDGILTQTDIAGPVGSGAFGTKVTTLPNGNFVVTDPEYDLGAISNVGAVHLYDGQSLALISTLTGSHEDDQVSRGGVVVLANGNFVVLSPDWANGDKRYAGAVTWVDGASGLHDVVAEANSLVGGAEYDNVGWGGVVALNNGS